MEHKGSRVTGWFVISIQVTVLYAGLDVSTQSTKFIVIDLKKSIIVHEDRVNYDQDLPQYKTRQGMRTDVELGVSESNPHMWLDSLEILFERIQTEPNIIERIDAISVSGQQHGLVALTSDGDLAHPYAKLWNDFSTEEECRILTERVGGVDEMIRLIGNTQRTGYTASKILHMFRHEQESYQKTTTFLLVHNYINWYLTGGSETGISVMEAGDASGSAMWNPVSRNWSDKVIDCIDTELKSKLPPVKPSRDLVGPIGKKFVDKFGFSSECMIASGSGDNMMAALGTGNYREGIITVSLGTSGTAYTFMKAPFVDESGEIACFCDATGNYIPMIAISNMANGYNTILEQFKMSHEEFDQVVRKTKPGNEGRVLCPWYGGERTPDLPSATPVYFGFNLEDFTPSILSRAVLEGHIMNLYEGFARLPVQSKEIRLTGGLAQSLIWRETIANIFNCDVAYVSGETAALGAALHAAWSHQKELSIEEIVEPVVMIDDSMSISPDPNQVRVYKDYRILYSAVSAAIRGLKGSDPFEVRRRFLSTHFI